MVCKTDMLQPTENKDLPIYSFRDASSQKQSILMVPVSQLRAIPNNSYLFSGSGS